MPASRDIIPTSQKIVLAKQEVILISWEINVHKSRIYYPYLKIYSHKSKITIINRHECWKMTCAELKASEQGFFPTKYFRNYTQICSDNKRPDLNRIYSYLVRMGKTKRTLCITLYFL